MLNRILINSSNKITKINNSNGFIVRQLTSQKRHYTNNNEPIVGPQQNETTTTTTTTTTSPKEEGVIISSTVAGSTVTKVVQDKSTIYSEKNREKFEREVYQKVKSLSNGVKECLKDGNWKLYKESEKKSMLKDLNEYLSDPKLMISERTYGLFIGYCLSIGKIEDAKFFFSNIPPESIYYYPFNSILLYYLNKNELRPMVEFFDSNIIKFKSFLQSTRFMVFLRTCIIRTTKNENDKIAMKLFEKLLSIVMEKLNSISVKKEGGAAAAAEGDKEIINLIEKVYHHAIGALIHSKRIDEALAMYNGEYLKFTDGRTDGCVYFFLLQALISRKDFNQAKEIFEKMKKEQVTPSPAIYYHLLTLAKEMNEKEYFKSLVNDMNIRGSGNVAALVLLYAENGNTELYKELTEIIDNGICGRDPDITNDTDRISLVRTVDTLMRLLLKINKYHIALEWYAKRIAEYKFVPNFKNIGDFIIYHVIRHEDALRDYWSDVLDRYGAYVTEDFFKQLFQSYSQLEPARQINIIKEFLEIGSGKEDLLPTFRDEDSKVIRRGPTDPSLNRLVHESTTRGLGQVLVNYLNKMYLSKDKIPPNSLLIEAISAIKSTGDAKLYIYELYLPASKYIRSIIFDPFIYTVLLNPDNPRPVINFGLDLIYREPDVTQNLVPISGAIFNVFLKDGNLEIANEFLNRMILNNKKFYLSDLESTRQNYLNCTLQTESINKIANLIKQEQKVQAFISNLFLSSLLKIYLDSRNPSDGKSLLKYFNMVKEIDIDSIKIYIDYLIKDNEFNIKNSDINNIDEEGDVQQDKVINNLLKYDSKIIKNLLESKLKELSFMQRKKQQYSSTMSTTDQKIEVYVGESSESIEFTLPKSKEIKSTTTTLTIDQLKNLNEFDLIIQVLINQKDNQYIQSVLKFLLNQGSLEKDTGKSYLASLSQNTFELLLNTAYNLKCKLDIIYPLFEKYHQENNNPKEYNHAIIDIVLKTTSNYDKQLFSTIKQKPSKISNNTNNPTTTDTDIPDLLLPPQLVSLEEQQ